MHSLSSGRFFLLWFPAFRFLRTAGVQPFLHRNTLPFCPWLWHPALYPCLAARDHFLGGQVCAAGSQWTTLLQSHAHLLRFAFSGNTPAATFVFFFNSLSRMLGVITFRHICLTSMFLSSGPEELVGSVQIPNSRVFQSLPFIWIFYQIILLLSTAQKFASDMSASNCFMSNIQVFLNNM